MRLEINRPKRWYSGYRVELVETAIEPLVALEDRLREFIGLPNNEVTRARIQSILDRWNFVYHDNITLDDLNLE